MPINDDELLSISEQYKPDPGTSPYNALQDDGLSAWERLQVMNLATSPKSAVNWIQKRHPDWEVQQYGSGLQIAVKAPGDYWKVVDPEHFEPVFDIADLAGDLGVGIASGVGAVKGAVLGSAVPVAGTFAGATGGGALGAAAGEGIRQGIGALAGFEEDLGERAKEVVESAAFGLAGEGVLRAGAGLLKAGGKAGKWAFTDKAPIQAGKEAIEQAPQKVTGKLVQEELPVSKRVFVGGESEKAIVDDAQRQSLKDSSKNWSADYEFPRDITEDLLPAGPGEVKQSIHGYPTNYILMNPKDGLILPMKEAIREIEKDLTKEKDWLEVVSYVGKNGKINVFINPIVRAEDMGITSRWIIKNEEVVNKELFEQLYGVAEKNKMKILVSTSKDPKERFNIQTPRDIFGGFEPSSFPSGSSSLRELPSTELTTPGGYTTKLIKETQELPPPEVPVSTSTKKLAPSARERIGSYLKEKGELGAPLNKAMYNRLSTLNAKAKETLEKSLKEKELLDKVNPKLFDEVKTLLDDATNSFAPKGIPNRFIGKQEADIISQQIREAARKLEQAKTELKDAGLKKEGANAAKLKSLMNDAEKLSREFSEKTGGPLSTLSDMVNIKRLVTAGAGFSTAGPGGAIAGAVLGPWAFKHMGRGIAKLGSAIMKDPSTLSKMASKMPPPPQVAAKINAYQSSRSKNAALYMLMSDEGFRKWIKSFIQEDNNENLPRM